MLRPLALLIFSVTLVMTSWPGLAQESVSTKKKISVKQNEKTDKETKSLKRKSLEIKALHSDKALETHPEELPIPSSYILHKWFSGKGKVEPNAKLLRQSEHLIEQVGYRIKSSEKVSDFLEMLSREAMSFGKANFHDHLQESLPVTRTSQNSILIYSRGKLERPDVLRAIVTEKSIHYFYNGLEVTRRKDESPEAWYQRVFHVSPRGGKNKAFFQWLTPSAHAQGEIPWERIFSSALVLSNKIRVAKVDKILTAQARPLVESHGLKCEGVQARLKAGVIGKGPVELEVQDLGSSIMQTRLYEDREKPAIFNLTHDWGTGVSTLERPNSGDEKEAYQDPNEKEETPLTLDLHNILAMTQDPISYPSQDRSEFMQAFAGLRVCLNLAENQILSCERHQEDPEKYLKCVENEVLSTGAEGPLRQAQNSLERTRIKAQIYLLFFSYQDLHDFPPYPATADPLFYRIRMNTGVSGMGISRVWELLSLGLDPAVTLDAEILECIDSDDPSECSHKDLFEAFNMFRNKNALRKTALTSLHSFREQLNSYKKTSCYKAFAKSPENLKTLHYHADIEKSRKNGDPIVASYEYLDELQSLSNISGRCCALESCRNAVRDLNFETQGGDAEETVLEEPS